METDIYHRTELPGFDVKGIRTVVNSSLNV